MKLMPTVFTVFNGSSPPSLARGLIHNDIRPTAETNKRSKTVETVRKRLFRIQADRSFPERIQIWGILHHLPPFDDSGRYPAASAVRRILHRLAFCEIGERLENFGKFRRLSAIDAPIGHAGGPCEQVDVRGRTTHEDQRQAGVETRIDLGRHHKAHEFVLQRDKMSVGR